MKKCRTVETGEIYNIYRLAAFDNTGAAQFVALCLRVLILFTESKRFYWNVFYLIYDQGRIMKN